MHKSMNAQAGSQLLVSLTISSVLNIMIQLLNVFAAFSDVDGEDDRHSVSLLYSFMFRTQTNAIAAKKERKKAI